MTITKKEYELATDEQKKEIQAQLASGEIKIEGVEILPKDALSWDRTEKEMKIFLSKLCLGQIMILSDQWDHE